MSLMSTYGKTERFDEEINRSWKENGGTEMAKFKYPEVVHNHYKYRHMVDGHKTKKQSPISLGGNWVTHRWSNKVCIHTWCVRSQYNASWSLLFWHTTTQYAWFQETAGKKLIHNTYYVKDNGMAIRKIRWEVEGCCNELLLLLKKNKFNGAKIVQNVSYYPQFKGKICNKRVQTHLLLLSSFDLQLKSTYNFLHLCAINFIYFNFFSFNEKVHSYEQLCQSVQSAFDN